MKVVGYRKSSTPIEHLLREDKAAYRAGAGRILRSRGVEAPHPVNTLRSQKRSYIPTLTISALAITGRFHYSPHDMGWRMKLAGVAVVAGGIGVAGLYLRDTARIPAAQDSTTYTETAAFKTSSGQAIQLRVARCDLGTAGHQTILKVYGEVQNLSATEAPKYFYKFVASDGEGRTYRDMTSDEVPGANTFALRAGERHGVSMKFLVEPASLNSYIDLVSIDGAQTNKLIRLKSPQPLDLKLPDGQWQSFKDPRW